MNKVVAYLDLLGFSEAVFNSIEDAVMTLTSFNAILETGYRDMKLHPSVNADPLLKELAKRTSIDSFESFLPFSDSVFATSNDCSNFLMQLGHFVYSSFLFTAHIYAHPANPDDPTATTSIGIDYDSSGQPIIVGKPYHHPPALFRGGLAYGDVINLNPMAIISGQPNKINTLAGEAVVRAVRLEHDLKGPRLFFGQEIYERLDQMACNYCRAVPDNTEAPHRYEILWPAMGYITENEGRTEFHKFMELFEAAYNLWLPFHKTANEIVEPHYHKFIELIIASTLQIYDVNWNDKSYAQARIYDILNRKNVASIFGHLLK